MKRHFIFSFDNETFTTTKQDTQIEDWEEQCPHCGSHAVNHKADVIQFGFEQDLVTSLFQCDDCGGGFHWTYQAYSGRSDRYITRWSTQHD